MLKGFVSLLLVAVVIPVFAACSRDGEPSNHEQGSSELDSISESTPGVLQRDSSASTEQSILSAEPRAPIIDNPETVATGNMSVGYCDVREADNLCIDFTGEAWTEDGARIECANAPESSFEPDTCPGSNRIGTCVIHPAGDASLEIVHSFYEPMNPVLAEGICPGRFEAE
ncbi:MAG: hypothetical protein R3284_01935 [Rubricoccaceae bacterium]|nr:hypothetical protein [Rubricoccaceae bacterium]